MPFFADQFDTNRPSLERELRASLAQNECIAIGKRALAASLVCIGQPVRATIAGLDAELAEEQIATIVAIAAKRGVKLYSKIEVRNSPLVPAQTRTFKTK